MSIQVKVKILSPQVGVTIPKPKYATPGAAAMDLSACLERFVTILPGERAKIPTGIALQLPPSVVGLIFSRSGHGWKHGVTLGNSVGVLDSDYIGEVQIVLQNNGQEEFIIHPGDRIAQIAFLPVYLADLIYVDELTPTLRGEGGFGSTGV